MDLTRRRFLKMAGAGAVYAFSFSCSDGEVVVETIDFRDPDASNHAYKYYVPYTEWLVINPDSSITAHTGRTEMGQGLKTVLSNIISQAFEVPPDQVTLVMGDTDLCPDDGPTEGSSATRIVGWGYWKACDAIRGDLVRRAAKRLKRTERRLDYRDGAIFDRRKPSLRITIGELADEQIRVASIDPAAPFKGAKDYVDRQTEAANAEAIVTGTLTYTGDLFPGECDYASFLPPVYFQQLTKVVSADLRAARTHPGIHFARRAKNSAFVVGDSYLAVQEAMEKMKPVWKVPERPREFRLEEEIREGAELERMIEDAGDPTSALSESAATVSETYITQYASQAPIETETAIARVEDDGRTTVWASSQAPFKARWRIEQRLGIPEEKTRIIGMPVGGGFGVKVGTLAPLWAAYMAHESGRMVKYVYSRAHQFFWRGRLKEAVVADLESGVSPDGKLLARTIDIYQDEGHGLTEVYAVPNVRTRHFRSSVPVRHATMRGTSFVQSCYALESHTDMVAEAAGLDPVEFRKRNVAVASFGPLLDACAEMIGYDRSELPEDHGIGFAICHHGGRQLGAVAAEVSVNRTTGVIRVEHLAGAYDIGLVINLNTLTANTKGAMIWGLGYALFEEVAVDGHTSYVRSFDDYRIPRFSDVPPIELAFLDNEARNHSPRGCGELPVPPTAAAICNAVYRAIGVRFHTLPMTPERVLAALKA